jgi:hypothetical protein
MYIIQFFATATPWCIHLEKMIFGFIKHNIIKAVAYHNLDVTIILHMQFAQKEIFVQETYRR